jgi:SAM-dependent methyltransferase
MYSNPKTGNYLQLHESVFIDKISGDVFPIVGGIPRFCDTSNYSNNFGFQWNTFRQTQLDSHSQTSSSEVRFYAETGWDPSALKDLCVLEVGSGAGRFSEVILRTSGAKLFSVDYSNAVEANWENNSAYGERFNLAQASVYELPFSDECFDKVFCFGVLQHTPSVRETIENLVRKAKIGGEIVVDFYQKRGWWTKIHSKYILRPVTKRLPPKVLLMMIKMNIRWLIFLFDFLCVIRLGLFTRFIPITDIRNFPARLDKKARVEWAVLDTFDGLSAQFDEPQRITDVARIFTDLGCRVNFSGEVLFLGGIAAVVRAERER